MHGPGLGSKGRVLFQGFFVVVRQGSLASSFSPAVCFGVPADSVPVRPAVPVFPSLRALLL